MRFIRNGRIRERVVDIASRALMIALSTLFCLWMISGARGAAAIEIKDIRQQLLSDGALAIDFVLSSKVTEDLVTLDFQRNFIQVSLKGVSAFPARTQKLNHELTEKVFTYQYQPDLARARVLLKTQANALKDTSSWETTKEGFRILVRGAKTAAVDAVKTRASSTTTTVSTSEDASEAQAVKEILEQSKGAAKGETTAASSAVAKPEKPVNSEDMPLFSGANGAPSSIDAKSKDSPGSKIFASLLLVIGIIGAGSLAFKKFALGKGIGLGFQRQGKMIEVVANQSVGAKKSVAIIKVLDQYMVVGMAGDGMSLLANLGNNVNLEKYMDEGGTGATFSDTFQTALTDSPEQQSKVTSSIQKATVAGANIRASIKKRMEGFKPL